jgi:RNA polymerase sigma-70 factor (ECF subfamily)
MKTTVVLVALQGLSNAEAAVVQGCSRGTIAWRLHEGHKRLLEATRKAPRRKKALSEHLGRLLEDAGLPVLDVEVTRTMTATTTV